MNYNFILCINNKRMHTYTIMGSGIGYSGGNYKNEVPSLAAKKAAKALFKKLTLPKFRKYKNKTSIKFVLRMRDRHGPGKTFSYVATCKKLKNPVVVKRGDAEYTIKYQYLAEPCKLNSTEVKTMTGGELALVGGKLTFTGKKLLHGGYDDDEITDDFVNGDDIEETVNNVDDGEDGEGGEGREGGEDGEGGDGGEDGEGGEGGEGGDEEVTRQDGGGKKKSKAKKAPAKKAPAKKAPAKKDSKAKK